MDTRVRGADVIFAELRELRGEVGGPVVLAILGLHTIDASDLAKALPRQWDEIVEHVGFTPKLLMTGCVDVGTEKAVRIAAKKITGRSAVVIHRAEMTYGKKPAEEMRDTLMAREADALVVIGTKNTCKHARERFVGWHKVVYEIEIE